MNTHPMLWQRALGSYLGLAIGDALGATVEFMTAHEIAALYRVHRHITGGGWLKLKPGQVTDDTGMALALGQALLHGGLTDTRLIADAFVRWMKSLPIDIGNTCRRGIRRYMIDGTVSAQPSPDSAGNGAAMRNLPVVLATLEDDDAFETLSLAQTRITHHHPLSDAATIALGRMTRRLLQGEGIGAAQTEAHALVAQHPDFRYAPWPGRTSGYVVDTVQTVLDAFLTTTSFEECLIKTVNRGGDADTSGALAGQLAGACYGLDAIPERWLKKLDPAINAAVREQTIRLIARQDEQHNIANGTPKARPSTRLKPSTAPTPS